MSASPKILVVDDEAGIRESLGSILRDERYAVDAVDSPDKRFHFGRTLGLRHAQVVIGDVYDGRPQPAIARRHGLRWPLERQQVDGHSGRRRHIVDGSVGEGESGHCATGTEADKRSRLLPRRFPNGMHRITFFHVSTRLYRPPRAACFCLFRSVSLRPAGS